MQGQAKYDVFISYSRKDTEVANRITAAFEREGITYFIDRQGIGGGLEFPAVLAQAIRESHVFLFLASRNSYDSKFTRNEIVYAFNKKEKTDIIPYIIDGSTLPDDLEFTFAAINWRDMREHPIETTLVSDVLNKLGRKPKPRTQQPQQESATATQPSSQTNVTSQQSQAIAIPEPPEPATTKPVKPAKTTPPKPNNRSSLFSRTFDWVLSKWWVLVLAALVFFIGIAVVRNSLANESISSSCPDSNHPHAIDLGLPSGTKWACCNVGAQKPEDYGGYFAWGETSTKDNYEWTTYRWCAGSDTMQTKYNTMSYFGIVDNRIQLENDDDAARANWHGSWRMPTMAELTELMDNCSYTWTTVNGVMGGKFTSRSNGRSIFLPAAGSRLDSTLGGSGECGLYWSSSLVESWVSSSYYLGFVMDYAYPANGDRHCGQSVRPVLSN